VLFLYAKLNPGIRYVQGMNEVPHPSTICDVLYLLWLYLLWLYMLWLYILWPYILWLYPSRCSCPYILRPGSCYLVITP
jgi:hypothetical protein